VTARRAQKSPANPAGPPSRLLVFYILVYTD
jgi:hypothetical protein